MKLLSIKIGRRLFLGFSIVVLLTITLGITALLELKELSTITEDMHNHPMVVSNTVRDIKLSLMQIQYNLHLNLFEQSSRDTMILNNETYLIQDKIEASFILINERFLGDKEDVKRAYDKYIEISPMLDRILYLIKENEIEEAIILNREMSSIYMKELNSQVQFMADFASNKSDEFYLNARAEGAKIFSTTIYFLVLIIFFSIVIGVYISFSVTKPLTKLIDHIKKLAVGDHESLIEVSSRDEIGQLTQSFKDMQESLKEVVFHAGKIADGDYSGIIPPRSEKDELAKSLNTMTVALKNLKEINRYQDWLKSGQNLLNAKMRGDKGIGELASTVITTLANYMNAKVGVIYTYEKDDKILKLAGSYAYSNNNHINNIALGEGIAGQVALEKKLISIIDVPPDYLPISSGLGNSRPGNIVAFPFVFDSELKGIIELGSFEIWSEKELAFFESIGEIIGVFFNSSETRASMRNLVEKQREQAKELINQQEELRASNEELEEKTESLSFSEERLRNQQEELRATNEELEEKTEHLENQRDEINRKNQELIIIQEDIIEKAHDLEISNRYKSEFLANMSHELRTPLNSLLILAKDLCTNRGKRLNDDDVQSAEIIYNSGIELLQLINEILDLAKIESGKLNMDVQNIPLTEISENILNQFSSIAKSKAIDLTVEISPDISARITSDKQKLNQVIKNLVSNALKFTNEGSVSVRLAKPSTLLQNKIKQTSNSDFILIEVQDTGIGIPEDQLETVFEAFKQVDGSTSREYGGTGLGLSISRELTSLLKGEILVESELNRGSTFSLIIPEQLIFSSDTIQPVNFSEMEIIKTKSEDQVITDNSESEHFILDDREIISKNDKTILIIEDDKNFALILQSSCREQHFKAIVTDTGERAIILVEKFSPDAIILDIKLPGMNGLQVLDHLKKNRATRHIPVHVISGIDRSAEVHDKGILGYLQKPIDNDSVNEVFSKIQRFIDKKVKDLLIVEDNNNLRTSIEKLIGNSDVLKTCVATGEEALTELSKKSFDCMILDLSLPDITGLELLSELEKRNLAPDLPVIIYTGKEIGYEEEFELRKYASSVIIKGVHSQERLLDETALFLHRIIKELPEKKQKMISKIYDEEIVFRDKKILIVDDDMRNVFAVSKILVEQGMIVEKAVNGQKALDRINGQSSNFDLVLMDIMMPVMDGYEAMRRIRKIREFDSLPILALTAKAMKEDRHKCIDAGANDYMTKPIDPDRLLSLMRVWLYK